VATQAVEELAQALSSLASSRVSFSQSDGAHWAICFDGNTTKPWSFLLTGGEDYLCVSGTLGVIDGEKEANRVDDLLLNQVQGHLLDAIFVLNGGSVELTDTRSGFRGRVWPVEWLLIQRLESLQNSRAAELPSSTELEEAWQLIDSVLATREPLPVAANEITTEMQKSYSKLKNQLPADRFDRLMTLLRFKRGWFGGWVIE